MSGSPVSVEELGARIVALSGRLAAATCRWLLLVTEFDAREGAGRLLMGSTAQWLQYACGIARRTAVEHVRVARVLAGQPRLVAEMSAGRLSYSQVRAISRVADLGDATLLKDLINLARHGTVGQLEDTVRRLRSVAGQDAAQVACFEPCLRRSWTEQSQYRLSARLDAEAGALLDAALTAVEGAEQLPAEQALVRLAEIAPAALRNGAAGELRQDEHAAVLIHLDAAGLPTEAPTEVAEPDEAASVQAAVPEARSRERALPAWRIDGGPGLSDAVLRRLLCAGRVRTVLDLGRNVLDLGRSHRLVTPKQFTALLLRDGGCTMPGCGTRQHLHAHHVRHWIDGGPTDLANLTLLCGRHHRALHDGAFHITATGNGTFTYRLADGRHWPDHPDTDQLPGMNLPIEDEHRNVDPTAGTTTWDGTRLDHDLAVSGIAQHLHNQARSRERAA